MNGNEGHGAPPPAKEAVESKESRKRKKRTILDASESLVRSNAAGHAENNAVGAADASTPGAAAATAVRVTRSSRFRNEGPPAPTEASEALQLAMSRSMSMNQEGIVGAAGFWKQPRSDGGEGAPAATTSCDATAAAAAKVPSSPSAASKRAKTSAQAGGGGGGGEGGGGGGGGRAQKPPRKQVRERVLIPGESERRDRERESRTIFKKKTLGLGPFPLSLSFQHLQFPPHSSKQPPLSLSPVEAALPLAARAPGSGNLSAAVDLPQPPLVSRPARHGPPGAAPPAPPSSARAPPRGGIVVGARGGGGATVGNRVTSRAPVLATMPAAAAAAAAASPFSAAAGHGPLPLSPLPLPPPPPQQQQQQERELLPQQGGAAAASAATVAAAHDQIDASAIQVRTATVTTGQLLQILVSSFSGFLELFFRYGRGKKRGGGARESGVGGGECRWERTGPCARPRSAPPPRPRSGTRRGDGRKKLTFFSLEKQNVFQDLWRSRALAAEDALATLM